MPWHREIRAFAEELAQLTSYHIVDESKDSEIVLLSRLKQPKRFE
jgi:wyosine [tRNA(Phe)-imidazoG37] synthetase (radical SAM superfamily)